MALSPIFVSARPSRQTMDVLKRQMELYGLTDTVNGPTTVEQLRDLVGDRWRKPHKSCDEVYPQIYVGDEKAAKDIDLLKNLGITHILNVACEEVPIKDLYYLQNGYRCTMSGIPAINTSSFNLKSHFDEANRFIEIAILIRGKILIHCKTGTSRAPTIAMAYLMMRKKMSALEAVKTVRSRRMCMPNDGFLRQLVEVDERLRKDRAI